MSPQIISIRSGHKIAFVKIITNSYGVPEEYHVSTDTPDITERWFIDPKADNPTVAWDKADPQMKEFILQNRWVCHGTLENAIAKALTLIHYTKTDVKKCRTNLKRLEKQLQKISLDNPSEITNENLEQIETLTHHVRVARKIIQVAENQKFFLNPPLWLEWVPRGRKGEILPFQPIKDEYPALVCGEFVSKKNDRRVLTKTTVWVN